MRFNLLGFGKTLSNSLVLTQYSTGEFFDEMFDGHGSVRPHYQRFRTLLQQMVLADFDHKCESIDLAFLRQGITFNVYGDAKGTERIFPFDPVPRVIPSREWDQLERGLAQRITALNLFLHDIYHEQRIL